MSLEEFALSAAFIISFVVVLSITIFFVGSAKSQAQPWIFLIAAVMVIFLGWGFQFVEKLRAANAPAPLPTLGIIAELVSVTCSVFAGALASVAITNRAKFAYDQEISGLKNAWYEARTQEMRHLARAGSLNDELQRKKDSGDPAAAPLISSKLACSDKSIGRRRNKRMEIEEKAKKLRISLDRTKIEYDQEKFELTQALRKAEEQEYSYLVQLDVLYDTMQKAVGSMDMPATNAVLANMKEADKKIEEYGAERRRIADRAIELDIVLD